jgi:hypothetical protein
MNVDSDITEHQPRRSDALVRRIAVHEASHAVARLVFDLDTVTGIRSTRRTAGMSRRARASTTKTRSSSCRRTLP